MGLYDRALLEITVLSSNMLNPFGAVHVSYGGGDFVPRQSRREMGQGKVF